MKAQALKDELADAHLRVSLLLRALKLSMCVDNYLLMNVAHENVHYEFRLYDSTAASGGILLVRTTNPGHPEPTVAVEAHYFDEYRERANMAVRVQTEIGKALAWKICETMGRMSLARQHDIAQAIRDANAKGR